jgi:hypothetical protein
MGNEMGPQGLYGGKVVIRRDQWHRYIIDKNNITGRTGIVKASVTTLLKLLDKKGLLQWAANSSVEYLREAYRAKKELTEADFELARKAHTAKATGAALTGGNVHDAVSVYIKAQIEGTPWQQTILVGAEQTAFDAFLAWVKTHEIRFVSTERVLYHLEMDVAGTMDVEYMEKGILYKADFKTTDLKKYRAEFAAGYLWPEWTIQVGAYAFMDGAEQAMCAGTPKQQEAFWDTYKPAMSVLVLDKVNGDFLPVTIEGGYDDAAAALLYLNGLYRNPIFTKAAARSREKWGR